MNVSDIKVIDLDSHWMEESPGRVEWVDGVRGRWCLVLVGLFPCLFGFALLALGAYGVVAPEITLVYVAVVTFLSGSLIVIVVAAVRLYYPFNRRVGMSELALIYDNGFRTFAFPWSSLHWTGPTVLLAPLERRMYAGVRINLTAHQATRIREFQHASSN